MLHGEWIRDEIGIVARAAGRGRVMSLIAVAPTLQRFVPLQGLDDARFFFAR
jgi:hypothetical protein